jgi:pimeloyl-ACP methyl ester carboxylesterase
VIRAAAVLSLATLACAACAPAFYAGKLPGAPADATFVEVDGVTLHYRDVGSGSPVVLVHGFGASLESWRAVQDALARTHRVIAVDLKGFGWSSRPDGDYSPPAEASLVWGVVDALGVAGPVAIAGHSWGSSVVLAMALERPDRVARLVLVSAYVYDEQVPSFFRWAQQGGMGDALFSLYYDERMEERVALAYHDDRFVTQAKVDAVEAEMRRPGSTAAALAAARGQRYDALASRYGAVKAPVLVLWGEDDQVTPVRFGERLERQLPDARLVVFPGCGHIPMTEARGGVVKEMRVFLAEAEAEAEAEAGTAAGAAAEAEAEAKKGSHPEPRRAEGAARVEEQRP